MFTDKPERRPPAPLPPPSAAEQARSDELAALIRGEIAAGGGALGFARFMELALYAPGLGYYSSGREPFGAAGDFVTAPELGGVFARLLGRQCAEILVRLGEVDVLEFGGGSGALAAELLAELERLGRLPREYTILELSGTLRAQQQERLRARVPHLLPRVRWLDRLPAGFRGIVLGNEVLDAMPVERFRVGDHGVQQLYVGTDDGRFTWRERPATAAVRERVTALGLPPGYVSEVGLAAEAWVRSLADCLDAGVVLLIDYGFPRAEFYHPQRSMGTLMCHYRHHAHDDPLVRVGLQDITAHVDFTAIAGAGAEAGLDLLGYTSQAIFLLGCGLDEIAAASDPNDVRAHLALSNEIRRLTLPQEMGELFKVIALGRGVDMPLRGFGDGIEPRAAGQGRPGCGFSVQDRRGRL